MIRLWLDDCRPAPSGWTHCRSVKEAIQVMKSGPVEEASLDHDLGWCRRCDLFPTKECDDHLSGRWLVKFMAREKCWPRQKPLVHSSNPPGAEWMRGMIDRYFVPAASAKETTAKESK